MSPQDPSEHNARRDFLGTLVSGAAPLGLASIASPLQANSNTGFEEKFLADDAEAWINKIKGKHKVVFDVPKPNDIFPFAWPRVFQITNKQTGTPENDLGIVVILRHDAIGYAMEDRLWDKYKFGEIFHADDKSTGKPAIRNNFYNVKADELPLPGMSINELQKSGVLFGVCDMALTVYSSMVAKKANMDAAEVKKDWVAGVLPGIQTLPSGVWALNRAQEKGCSYIYAG